ncbi:MAG: hypothetical protein K0S80_4433 [Neobacillus sp.]|nr:hypothetical protein [Neobacillus sp.]
MFDTKKGPVYEPDHPALNGMYELLKKHADTLSGSRLYEDLVDVYESINMDLKEEMDNGKTIKAS